MIVINKKSKAITITKWGQFTYLVSQNKQIHIWYHYWAYISNAYTIKSFKLANSIDLDIKNKYDPIEILVNSNNLDIFNILDHKYFAPNNISIMINIIAYQMINMNVFNKVFILYIRNKLFKINQKK